MPLGVRDQRDPTYDTLDAPIREMPQDKYIKGGLRAAASFVPGVDTSVYDPARVQEILKAQPMSYASDAADKVAELYYDLDNLAEDGLVSAYKNGGMVDSLQEKIRANSPRRKKERGFAREEARRKVAGERPLSEVQAENMDSLKGLVRDFSPMGDVDAFREVPQNIRDAANAESWWGTAGHSALAGLGALGALLGPIGDASRGLVRKLLKKGIKVDLPNVKEPNEIISKIDVNKIEHGESAMPGGKLDDTAKADIIVKEYADAGTEFPPISVMRTDDGKWMVVDGSHRLEAARVRGDDTIPVYVDRNEAVDAGLVPKQSPPLKGLLKTKALRKRFDPPSEVVPGNIDPRTQSAIDDVANKPDPVPKKKLDTDQVEAEVNPADIDHGAEGNIVFSKDGTFYGDDVAEMIVDLVKREEGTIFLEGGVKRGADGRLKAIGQATDLEAAKRRGDKTVVVSMTRKEATDAGFKFEEPYVSKPFGSQALDMGMGFRHAEVVSRLGVDDVGDYLDFIKTPIGPVRFKASVSAGAWTPQLDMEDIRTMVNGNKKLKFDEYNDALMQTIIKAREIAKSKQTPLVVRIPGSFGKKGNPRHGWGYRFYKNTFGKGAADNKIVEYDHYYGHLYVRIDKNGEFNPIKTTSPSKASGMPVDAGGSDSMARSSRDDFSGRYAHGGLVSAYEMVM